jgi:hypothetical protein
MGYRLPNSSPKSHPLDVKVSFPTMNSFFSFLFTFSIPVSFLRRKSFSLVDSELK